MTGVVARVVLNRGDFTLDIEVAVAPGEVVAVLGPNGAGKSSLLRALCGLAAIDQGQIVIGDVVVDDPARDVFVDPARRRIGFVFQDYRLFPHLSVLDNVAFGPRSAGASGGKARDQARVWIDRFGLTDLAGRRPGEISGGQAQRVALARALAAQPHALLLDEPLAALDIATRQDVRAELRSHLRSFQGPTILVTHDPLDALVLADRVVVLESGRVTQAGTTAQIAQRPATSYVAQVMGLNLLRGQASAGLIALDDGGELHAPDHLLAGPALVAVRPTAISLHAHKPEGSARNVWAGHVTGVQPIGDRVRVTVSGAPSVVVDVTAGAVVELGLVAGSEVWLSTKATELEVYPG
ncbi:MAG: ABC transporter ATP-binding protein [Actinomycetes bacterium]